MYISNYLILGQSPNYGKYKNINKYDENVSASHLLYRNNPINLLDMYQPNSITDISSITDFDTLNPKLYNLAKYTYDPVDNPNAPIKKDAITDTLVSSDNNHLGSNIKKIFYISKDKVLSENTFHNAMQMIIFHPLDYYYYKDSYYNTELEIGTKPNHFHYNTYTNSVDIIGNVTKDLINKIETNTLDNTYILFKDCTLASTQVQSLKSIYLVCDNTDKYIFQIDDQSKQLSYTNHKYIYYVYIDKNATFTFKILNKTDNSVIQQVTITVG